MSDGNDENMFFSFPVVEVIFKDGKIDFLKNKKKYLDIFWEEKLY